MSAIGIRLLGRFAVQRGNEEVSSAAFGGRMARTLVRILVSRRGSFVSKEELAEALWPNHPPSDPAGNLEVLVSRARRALGDPSLILTERGGYSFARDDRSQVDSESLLAHAERGREAFEEGRRLAALSEFQAAVDAWRGEPLAEDAYAEWAQEPRRELARVYIEALEGAAAAALSLGQPARAAALAERAAAREPLREAAQLLLCEALAASGDQAAALSCYEGFRLRLADELGLDPSPKATKLHVRVLRGEPVGLSSPTHRADSGVSLWTNPPPDDLAFVGRERELEAILAAIASSVPGVTVISGRSGAGKSRLLAESAMRGARKLVVTRAFLPEQQEPWSLGRSLLREILAMDTGIAAGIPDRAAQALVGIVPELEELRAISNAALEPESQRALAMEGAVRLMEAATSLGAIMGVDDLQWADATSLALLERAIRRIPHLGVIVAYRPEEIGPDGPVASFLSRLPGNAVAVTSLALPPLSEKAISELFVEEDLVRVVVEYSDGTPLAVAEMVKALSEQGALERDRYGRWEARAGAAEHAREVARAGQLRAIQSRADRQPPRRRELLALLALLGWEAPARILATATEAGEGSVLDDLDALARAELARLGDQGWTVEHDTIGEAVAGALPRASRGRLHGMLARALRVEGGEAAELARHLAGAGDAEAATEAFSQAAAKALNRHASDEAERLADEGLGRHPTPSVRSTLLEIRGEARARLDNLAGAREDLRGALGERRQGPERSRILARIAMLTFGAEDLPRAAELAELALSEAGRDPEARAGALFVGGVVDMNAGRGDRAKARFDEALELFEKTGNARGVADILDGRATATLLAGDFRRGVLALDRVARLFMDSGELLRVGGPRNERGWALICLGRTEEALSEIEEALDLERSLGHAEGESWCLTNRAEALAALGRTDDSIKSAQEALAVAERIGHREWTANALRALGLAHKAAGDLDRAEAAFRRSLGVAKNLPLFASWAAAGVAMVLIARGDLAGAEPFVVRALSEESPLAWYEARLAQAELAAARGDPDARALAASALSRAEAGGHMASAARLKCLAAGDLEVS